MRLQSSRRDYQPTGYDQISRTSVSRCWLKTEHRSSLEHLGTMSEAQSDVFRWRRSSSGNDREVIRRLRRTRSTGRPEEADHPRRPTAALVPSTSRHRGEHRRIGGRVRGNAPTAARRRGAGRHRHRASEWLSTVEVLYGGPSHSKAAVNRSLALFLRSELMSSSTNQTS